MINPFQLDYSFRLKEWKNLRLIIRTQSLENACVAVDKWWQQCPLINHHLHPNDAENWPDPWTILSDNTYCTLTRAIGICYTLLLSDIYDLNLVQALDNQGQDHNLVLVSNAKYVLNFYPNSVLSTNLEEFKILKILDLNILHKHIK